MWRSACCATLCTSFDWHFEHGLWPTTMTMTSTSRVNVRACVLLLVPLTNVYSAWVFVSSVRFLCSVVRLLTMMIMMMHWLSVNALNLLTGCAHYRRTALRIVIETDWLHHDYAHAFAWRAALIHSHSMQLNEYTFKIPLYLYFYYNIFHVVLIIYVYLALLSTCFVSLRLGSRAWRRLTFPGMHQIYLTGEPISDAYFDKCLEQTFLNLTSSLIFFMLTCMLRFDE